MKSILVTCYVNPDIDGVAGAFTYSELLQKLGQKTNFGIIGDPHEEARYVLNRFRISLPNLIKNADDYDQVILVDASDLAGLEGKVDPRKVVEIIDHRKVNDLHAFPSARAQIELVGAAATLIAERFKKNKVPISKESAILISSAIISNTINFRASVTTERDKAVAAWLSEIAGLPDNYAKDLFIAKSDLSGDKLASRIEGDFAHFFLGKKKVGIAQLEIIGAQDLITERENEIIEILNRLKKSMDLDLVFLNAIDLESAQSVLLAQDTYTKELLAKIFKVRFEKDNVELPRLFMRKQIVPLLKSELEFV